MAGFELSINGRSWVSIEARSVAAGSYDPVSAVELAKHWAEALTVVSNSLRACTGSTGEKLMDSQVHGTKTWA